MKSPFFAFRYHTAKRLGAPQWLVAFTAEAELNLPEFWKMIEEQIQRDLWPSALVLIVRDNAAATIAGEIQDLLQQEADWRAGLNRSAIVVIGFDGSGECASVHKCNEVPVKIDPGRFAALLGQGLRKLFISRNGLLDAPPSSHFIFPSGKHGAAFMRVANILMYGPEINFVALGLLRHLGPKPRYLLIDTSSIASVALAAIVLRVQLEPSFRPPVIGSFSSWTALRDGVDFPPAEGLKVVISASTSGKMAREIRDTKNIPENQIVTLFSLAENRSGTEIVCDLATDVGAPPEWDVRRSAEYASTQTCELCRAGSRPITFVGDQFLADAVTYHPVDVHQRNAPEQLAAQMEAYYGKNAFAMKNRGGGTAVDEYYVNLPKIMETNRFSEALVAAVARHVPASTGLLVSPGDSDSVALASRVQDMLESYGGKKPPLIRAQDLRTHAPALDEVESIIIVSGAIETGAQVQSIDRALRDPYGSRPRLFLTGLIKHQNSPGTAHVLKDLEFSGTRHRHGVVKLEEMVLPPRPAVSAWAAELNLLAPFIDEFEPPPAGYDEATLNAFWARAEQIDRLAQVATDGFFWPSPNGKPLQLRQTFAFWPFEYVAERVSQGDVLVTIASVLQNVREGQRPEMWQSAFHQSLLSPTMFNRYNDGIIQAAFLRCALPHELDYSGDAALSAQMGALLGGFFAAAKDDAGEGLNEFLVAIATGRLKLCPVDLEAALRCLQQPDPVTAALSQLCLKAGKVASDAGLAALSDGGSLERKV